MAGPAVPRTLKRSSLKRMSISRLSEKEKQLEAARSRLWKWGFENGKLSSKEYVRKSVKLKGMQGDIYSVKTDKIIARRVKKYGGK